MNILLFAGATEGRLLAERLRALPLRATICVATEYGGDLLGDLPDSFTVLTGRMDKEGMRALMGEKRYEYVIDATHPYATSASANIRASASAASLSSLRLAREESPMGAARYVADAAAAAAALASVSGNVLLTTGVKDLQAFTSVAGYAERMYPRVLPTAESVTRCVELGFKRDHVIAMQGPFSRNLNAALMREFSVAFLVTKDGGMEGGFPEKMDAAKETGAQVLVIGRPPENEGLTMDEVLAIIRAKLGTEA